MLQLLLGNVGRPGGGVNAFRGHSNIQGATDMGGTFEILPGYLKTPTGAAADLDDIPRQRHARDAEQTAWASMNYWTNYPKFMVSLLKALYGEDRDEGERLRLRVAPEGRRQLLLDVHLRRHVPGHSTRVGGKEPGPEGLITFGMNPVGIGPQLEEDGRRARRS